MAIPAEPARRPRARAARWLEAAWLARGPLACMLLPLAWLFGGAVALRRALYRSGWLQIERLPVPLVVVGNLIVGGAGKTPTVMAVVSLLRTQGYRPGVISRGHGRTADHIVEVQPGTPATASGDEPLLLRIRLGVPVVVGRDRVGAARELLRRHPQTDAIVSDDGLQHLRLARDVQLLLFDARGVGNGWLLPAGPLREPVPARVSERTLVVYNAAAPTTPWPGHCARAKLAGAVALADWWSGVPAAPETLAALAVRPLLAAAGTAQPARFFDMLAHAGLSFDRLELPDHFDFAPLPWPANTPDVIVTEKDAVKLAPPRMGSTRVWVAPLDFDIGAAFDTALLQLLPRRAAATGPNPHGHPTA